MKEMLYCKRFNYLSNNMVRMNNKYKGKNNNQKRKQIEMNNI